MGDEGPSRMVLAAVDEFVQQLRRRQVVGSTATAKRTAMILRVLVTKSRRSTPEGLLQDVLATGMQMQAAKPLELAVGNIVRRVLHLIREESEQEDEDALESERSLESESPSAAAASSTNRGVHFAAETPPASSVPAGRGLLSKALRPGGLLSARKLSLANLLDHSVATPATVGGDDRDYVGASPLSNTPLESTKASLFPVDDTPFSAASSQARSETGDSDIAEGGRKSSSKGQRSKAEVWKRRSNIIEELNELIDELDDIDGHIAAQAPDHIHANEVILTFGGSAAVSLFLKEAAKKRSFQLVVAEGAPTLTGHAVAADMAARQIPTTLIPDAAIFALMARVNKVVVGSHALLANGGIIAAAGTALAAQAARKHAVPLVVLVGLHQLSPMFPDNPLVNLNDFNTPGLVLDYDATADALQLHPQQPGVPSEPLEVLNPMYDYVAPELISLFVTDTGGYVPSYCYRLLAEYYTREDYDLETPGRY